MTGQLSPTEPVTQCLVFQCPELDVTVLFQMTHLLRHSCRLGWDRSYLQEKGKGENREAALEIQEGVDRTGGMASH